MRNLNTDSIIVELNKAFLGT